ncbi:hypothetical protein EOS_32230 [Caballeronia mineralivorans PML1(12)]|uniref:Uncharacterized protein n=1 Tax=Caballeronia mineralivorans PML1(12) TaxID=908627 RepID=A0A0J1CP75_9BURK|nr:hypothetical protein EOS_32230 [Caballeronia mineralivorans PML1(12)]
MAPLPLRGIGSYSDPADKLFDFIRTTLASAIEKIRTMQHRLIFLTPVALWIRHFLRFNRHSTICSFEKRRIAAFHF